MSSLKMIQSTKFKGYVMILASAVCFGSYGVWSRFLGREFEGFYQGWVRSAIILMILLPIAIMGKHLKPIKKPHRKWFTVTMIFTVFTQVPLYYAFNHLPLGTATLLFYGLFLITSYLIGWIFLAEKITLVKMISLVLALVGLFVTFGLSLAVFSVGAMLLAAFNGIASGGEIATSKKSTGHYSSMQVVIYSCVLDLITHLPLSLLLHEKQVMPAFTLLWLAMFAHAISGFGGYWLVIEGFKFVDASIGSLIGLLEIVFSVLFGVYFFNDPITIPVIWGGLIILSSAILPDIFALSHPKAKPTPPPPPV